MTFRSLLSARSISIALVFACLIAFQSPANAQRLTGSANPPTGVAGFNNSYVVGSGFPSGAISTATASFATTCGGAAVGSGPATGTIVGPLRHFQFLIPASLASGTYFVTISGTEGGTTFNTASVPSCATIGVTATSTTLAACVPTSSLAVTAGTNVIAYVPFGSWGEGSTSGIEQVSIEGSVPAKNFATTGLVNSCASNSSTAEVVCTENSANVDLINGSTLTTVVSGSNSFASFSGGSCQNCGVGINPANNTAVIAMGYSPSGSGAAVQTLHLSSNTFDPPFPLANRVSEDISIDSGNSLILSPGESGVYDIIKIAADNKTLTEYSQTLNEQGGELDSAAEDCTTEIGYAADEFTNLIYITDLSQATYTAGTPGTWTAPGQFVDLSVNESGFEGFAAGTCGISTAPGSSHLGIVTGEFGGSSFAVFKGPSTSGVGTPALADYAYVSSLTLPSGGGFSAGFDPHTVTAYTSPNTNKSYGVLVDWSSGQPDYLAIVDLAAVLAAPRIGTSNTVDLTAGSPWVRYIVIP